jgi:hypothetical protein
MGAPALEGRGRRGYEVGMPTKPWVPGSRALFQKRSTLTMPAVPSTR